jgi:N-acyl-L-homoserine lactone synthetase
VEDVMKLIETRADEAEEAAAMRAMFAARKEVFIDLLGWDVPVLDGRYEIDHFDDVHARYLILLDPDGRHRASTRLLPTMRPHILDALFGALCQDEPPRGAHIYEVTRFCLDRHQRTPERRVARNRLVAGLADFAVASGIEAYTGVADVAWFDQICRFGWKCAALGESRLYGGQRLVAFRIDIAADTIDRLIDTGIYDPASASCLRMLSEAA